MNCPNCNNIISVEQTHCDECGSDILILAKLYKLSNTYYNKGLEKARIRDLSGAVFMLRACLKIYKYNTNARNLLGLVLFEMGETVAAISEWVISKHFQAEDNEAERFMDLVQQNPTKLDSKNQAIRKYNIALEAAQQGNEDLAIIQLKKVVGLEQNFLRAAHLLSLLYIKSGELDKAYKLLNRTKKIDIANTTTLRYLSNIKKYLSSDDARDKLAEELPKAAIMPIVKYKEDKPNILAWVNWFLGMAIGIALTFILVVPTVKNNIRAEYNKEDLNYAAELNILNANITSNEKEITSLKMQLLEKTEEVERLSEAVHDPLIYDQYFGVILKYQEYLEDKQEKEAKEIYDLAKEFADIYKIIEASQEALTLYEAVTANLYPAAAEYAYEQGRGLYDAGNYEAANSMISDAYMFLPDRADIIYLAGQICQKLEQYVQAAIYYNLIIDEHPDTSLAIDARERLDEMEMR